MTTSKETPSKKLIELGVELPPVVAPAGSYIPAVRIGDLVMTAGQVPVQSGAPLHAGIVGRDVTLEQAQACALLCAKNALAAAASVVGGVDQIERIVRVCVFVASAQQFTDQPKVANAASDFYFDVFGEAGRHVRSAVGVASLPMNTPVELELVARVRS